MEMVIWREMVKEQKMAKERCSVKEKAEGLELAMMLLAVWVKALFVVLGWVFALI